MSKEFGDRLRSRRKECEMTTTACAAALGVTQPAWNQWELGIREPKLDMLIKVAKLLDCSADLLLGLRTPPRPVRVTAIDAGDHAVVAIGDKSRTTVRVTSAAPGKRPDCNDCPYKEKMKEFEAFFTATKKKGKRK